MFHYKHYLVGNLEWFNWHAGSTGPVLPNSDFGMLVFYGDLHTGWLTYLSSQFHAFVQPFH